MKRHLIALDLDGTLLTNDHRITARTEKVLLTLIKQGHIVVIVTGRPFHSSIGHYQQLGLNTPLINHNGALIQNPSQPFAKMVHHTLDFMVAKQIIQVLEKSFNLIALSAERLQAVYLQKSSPIFEYLYQIGTPEMIRGDILQNLQYAPTSLLLHTKEEETESIKQYLEKHFSSYIEHRSWGMPTTIVEVTKRGINKAAALQQVADAYHIQKEQIIAFGDQDNDFEMLQFAGIGVAMENAYPKLKEIANAVTLTNEEEGVAEFLESVFSQTEKMAQ